MDGSYIETVTRRDLFELTDIRRKAAFLALLRWAATATATEVNITGAANDLGIDRTSVVSYLEWLRTVILVRELPPWSRNFTSRAVRRTKLYFTDTGLAGHPGGDRTGDARPGHCHGHRSPAGDLHGQRDLPPTGRLG